VRDHESHFHRGVPDLEVDEIQAARLTQTLRALQECLS
jgi:hypothetical protein